MNCATASLRIAFLHPDLGIGGAERLVVDAAVQLQAAGHRVTVFTAHHDRTRCFEETRDGSLRIRVYGQFLPSHIGQRLRAPCAIGRMAYLTCRMAFHAGPFDVIFCDLVPHMIPLVRQLVRRTRIVFYCHFPDQLLTPPRRALYQWYRTPIDWLEEVGIGMADRVLVNSQFTASVFRQTFSRLRAVPIEIVYPGIDTSAYVSLPLETTSPSNTGQAPPAKDLTLLCLSRYERKKNMALAIDALGLLREQITSEIFARVRLVIAGGYDQRLRENQDTLRDLQARARQLDLTRHVVFICSISDDGRRALLSQSLCVVYTPQNEHFGLVPLEAMAAGRPVIAVDSGGPRETVQHQETGLLCPPTPQAFAAALTRLILDRRRARQMGQAGRGRVAQHFSRSAFGHHLEQILHTLVRPDTVSS